MPQMINPVVFIVCASQQLMADFHRAEEVTSQFLHDIVV